MAFLSISADGEAGFCVEIQHVGMGRTFCAGAITHISASSDPRLNLM